MSLITCIRCSLDLEARYYAQYLRSCDIPVFLTSDASANILPLPATADILLQVPEGHRTKALEIIALAKQEMDHYEPDYRDADLEDIRFEQALHHPFQENNHKWVLLIVILLIVSLTCAGLAGWRFF